MEAKTPGWYAKVAGAVALIAAAVAGLATFLGNVGTIRDFVTGEAPPPSPVADLAVRLEKKHRPIRGEDFTVTAIIDNRNGGMAKNCRLNLLQGMSDLPVSSMQSVEPFEITPDIRSIRITRKFFINTLVDDFWDRTKLFGSHEVTVPLWVECDGVISERIDADFTRFRPN